MTARRDAITIFATLTLIAVTVALFTLLLREVFDPYYYRDPSPPTLHT